MQNLLSLTRDWTQGLSMRMLSPNHWATIEFPQSSFFSVQISVILLIHNIVPLPPLFNSKIFHQPLRKPHICSSLRPCLLPGPGFHYSASCLNDLFWIFYINTYKKWPFVSGFLNMEWPSWGSSQYFIPLYAWAMFYSVNTKPFVYHTLWINVDRHLGGFHFLLLWVKHSCAKRQQKKSVRCC